MDGIISSSKQRYAANGFLDSYILATMRSRSMLVLLAYWLANVCWGDLQCELLSTGHLAQGPRHANTVNNLKALDGISTLSIPDYGAVYGFRISRLLRIIQGKYILIITDSTEA